MAPGLLADLYEFDGAEDDAISAPGLSAGAFAVASALLDGGPASKPAVRGRLGMSGKEIEQPVAELGRRLLITHYGVEEGPGWAACVWARPRRSTHDLRLNQVLGGAPGIRTLNPWIKSPLLCH
jgi:hypothetical protein